MRLFEHIPQAFPAIAPRKKPARFTLPGPFRPSTPEACRLRYRALAALWPILIWPLVTDAGPLRDWLAERRTQTQENVQQKTPEIHDTDADTTAPPPLPAGIRVIRDVPYGNDPQQRFDIYVPAQERNAPVIFMVHGGAWRYGDKAEKAVIENKVARWVPKGFVFISTNYRLLPQADPVEQARDVARALAVAQDQATSWGGDRGKFILMGHSAGAHLVSLLSTQPSLAAGNVPEPTPWLGTVSLDSAAFDVVGIMEQRHLPLYDNAFGTDRAYWRSASPLYTGHAASRPILAVCSVRRADACAQAWRFAARATVLGGRTTVLEKDLSHREINQHLGAATGYTAEVEAFLGQLDKTVADRLENSRR